ncbi:hypothetical protein BD311DRAFT_329158 [Dichomitus squalens]|uniref:DUF6533 domain-containing protein n=1 Tax=Dichomitus squalens TaxID=114155 RepID=A0A4V2K6F4_9APHY|nr:hypothetical protein BD311DRAFT_329158 [Dichomitus squalens]TBU51813.1 hypothetical protein BD310DRAFT_314456 [Dichomitus squalens]
MLQGVRASSKEIALASVHTQQLILSALVLLIYDTIVTATREVRLIWRRKLHSIDLLYIVNREKVSMGMDGYIRYGRLYTHRIPLQTVFELYILEEVTTILPNVSWAAFTGYRTYALAERNALIGWVVFLLSAVFILPNIDDLIRTVHLGCLPHTADCYAKPLDLQANRASKHESKDLPLNSTRLYIPVQ